MTTTTPSTASQAPAVSIDTPEFRRMLTEFATTWFDHPGEESKRLAIFKYIDAKLAQASNDSSSKGRIYQRKVDEKITERWKARATAAEAKLEAIRQGVRECVGFGFDKDGPNWISRQQVLALLQPQTKAAKEAEQRQRMQERFANRPKTPATADFDLPYASNSDGPDYSKADESGLTG